MKNHYEVLNLDKTCTSKEIKDSFIKLSKKYHPDKNKSSDAHKKFVEVNEAYSVLGKADTRCKYDESLYHDGARVVYRPSSRTSTTVNTPYEYYAHMYAQNLKRNQDPGGYITKRKIGLFFFCCLLMVIGSGIQLKADMNRRARRSQEIARMLKESRERNQKKRKSRILGDV